MKLCAIYNVWDDWDLLTRSLTNIKNVVDGVIIVASNYSSHKEYSEIPDTLVVWADNDNPMKIDVFHREPQYSHALHSETDKRNYGLEKARELGYTHFITMDADECLGI